MRSTFLISHLISHLWDLLCILKYMFCFFKLTSKIVRATKDILSKGWAGHSPTAVYRALALRKQKDFYSNIWFKIKRKKNLKNAVVTHNFYIDLHLMFPKCLALIRVLCCFWTQPFYKSFQQAAVLSVQQPSQPLGYGTFVFQMRKASEDLHRARDVAISELSESSSISEETHRNPSVEQSWCRALWYGTVTLTRARQRLCWAPLSLELFLKCHKCFWEVIIYSCCRASGATRKTWSDFQNTALGLQRGLSLPHVLRKVTNSQKDQECSCYCKCRPLLSHNMKVIFPQVHWSHSVFQTGFHLANRGTKCSNKRSSWLFLINWNND